MRTPAAYNPRFDPLVDADPGCGQANAPTYWAATAGAAPPDDGPVQEDCDVDVAIIGAGYTGLACAMHLARDHGVRAVVLEANRAGWGCSGRNGGQGQLAAGRLYRSQWIARWGKPTALKLHEEICDSFECFKSMIAGIDCDQQPGGHLLLAHRNGTLPFLRDESRVCNAVFGYRTQVIGRDEVHRDHVRDNEAQGALFEPTGISVHPLKLAHGLLASARAAGARVHTASPVLAWETRAGVQYLKTPGGIVRARAVGVATGGYTTQALHPSLRSRIMPILSNSLVTRPMTPAEKAECNFTTPIALTDTRTLRFYYRRLPDDRVQIGSRSAITGADAGHQKHQRLLVSALHRKFPPLRNIEIAYSWWGWVDVSHDMMPRVYQPDPAIAAYYALGYGGNGVSFSAFAGRRMAERIAGRSIPELPIYDSPLPGHMFSPFRRIGQRLLFSWYQLRDEFL